MATKRDILESKNLNLRLISSNGVDGERQFFSKLAWIAVLKTLDLKIISYQEFTESICIITAGYKK